MSAGEIIAVLDAGPLIHLDQLGSLGLLAGYREVLLPERQAREAGLFETPTASFIPAQGNALGLSANHHSQR